MAPGAVGGRIGRAVFAVLAGAVLARIEAGPCIGAGPCTSREVLPLDLAETRSER